MKEKIYRLNLRRLFFLSLTQLFYTGFLIFMGCISPTKGIGMFILLSVFFLFTSGVAVYLFFNHLPYARQCRLVVNGKLFTWVQGDGATVFRLEDIEEITEYSVTRAPWEHIKKWRIKTARKELLVSSLSISSWSFEGYFWNKIKHRNTYLPRI